MKTYCGYLLEISCQGCSKKYPQHMFLYIKKRMKIGTIFFIWITLFSQAILCPIAQDKALFFNQKLILYFSYFSIFNFHENICYGMHQKHLIKMLLMSTHNACFNGDMKKKKKKIGILLSGAVMSYWSLCFEITLVMHLCQLVFYDMNLLNILILVIL